ncbi:mediator of RNA polymerase II transcription subunit 26-like isoform X2 [Entelurus aequoreus]|uniref:mediator of RNA polymerase II transcription subunit 26-like isoform X2 n=1 Tax=Entelurus aequoreus TaxID=161455 RepID=UPI002B1DB4EC|nr:mediator of RNA polymerase II transcription subunit 26-like isoform X2 [Entelurus aequoreus]
MTATTATPQGMRDRLLEAIDVHSNEISNIVIVMEVISFLEKYPITKEALEETRLGKLVNDVRKKTKNEDLAKRAKKLVRTWQNLISPGRSNVYSKGKTGVELKHRKDLNNWKKSPSNRKHTEDSQEGLSPAKMPKKAVNGKSQYLLSSKNKSGADILTDLYQTVNKDFSKLNNSGKLLNVKPAQPHPSSPGSSKPPSASLLLKASVLQQQQAAFKEQHQPNTSVHFKLQEGAAPAQNICTQTLRLVSTDTPVQTLKGCLQGSQEDDGAFTDAANNRQNYRFQDDAVKLDRGDLEDTKHVRLKDRRLIFNAVTGQIQASVNKEKEKEKLQTEQQKQNPPLPLSLLQHTDWKELSRSEIIRSYLSQQSSILTSSGARTPTAHFFITDIQRKEDKKTHELISEPPSRVLPGVGREISNEEVQRLHTEHWSGVNGCYDTRGDWYQWTQCISLDPHGDESRLDILPYVCLD